MEVKFQSNYIPGLQIPIRKNIYFLRIVLYSYECLKCYQLTKSLYSFLIQWPRLKGKSYRSTIRMHTHIDNHEETVIYNFVWCSFVLLFSSSPLKRTTTERSFGMYKHAFMVNGWKLNFITADCMLFKLWKNIRF